MALTPYRKLSEKIAGLRSIEFMRGVATLVKGNLAAQVIMIGAAPVITRLFDPEEFGIFALFTALVTIVGRIGALCYERSLVLPERVDVAYDVLVISLTLLVFMTALSALVAGVYGEQIAAVLGSQGRYTWIYLVPIGVFFMGAASVGRYWALRNKEFRRMTRARVLDASVSALIKIVIGIYAGSWVGGLIVGMLSGSVVASLVITGPLVKVYQASGYKPSAQSLRSTAMEYSAFPLYASWNALISTLSMRIMVFFLSIFFGPAVTGFYSLSTRIMRQPVEIISQAVANAYYRESAHQAAGNRSPVTGLRKTTSVLMLSGLLPFILLGLFGRELFELVFGSGWGEAGYYCEILSPWFFLLFISGPSKMIFEVYQRQKFKLIINISMTVLSLLSIFMAYYLTGSVVEVIVAFAMVSSLMEIVFMIASFRIASNQVQLPIGNS